MRHFQEQCGQAAGIFIDSERQCHAARWSFGPLFERLIAINETAAFDRWSGFRLTKISPGEAELEMTRRPEHGQYNDFLHAGVIAALIDTCCGFAAATLIDRFLASHFSVNCLSPAAGNQFLAKGRVIKHGRKQIFARGELFVIDEPNAKLVAAGDTILVPLDGTTTSS
jgi:uncharacterized protein (TIGR00369 family)